MTDILNIIATGFMGVGVIPLVIFIVRYAFFSPVNATEEGRNLLLMKMAMLGLLLVGFSTYIFGEFPGREVLRFVLYAWLLFLFTRDTYYLLRIQKQFPWSRRKKKTEAEKAPSPL